MSTDQTHETHQTQRPAGETADALGGERPWWALWGVAAGVLGATGHLFNAPPAAVMDAHEQGAAVIEMLDRNLYHVGAVAGIGAVLCVLLFASGWRRWASRAAGASIAAGAASMALTASAAAMIFGYGLQGALSIYLPGGLNAGEFPNDGLYVLYMFLDLGPFMAWWGVAAAALFVSWLSLVERRLPVLVGVFGALGWLPSLAMLAVTGLTGFPGVVGPVWLVLTSLALVAMRSMSGLTAEGGLDASRPGA